MSVAFTLVPSRFEAHRSTLTLWPVLKQRYIAPTVLLHLYLSYIL